MVQTHKLKAQSILFSHWSFELSLAGKTGISKSKGVNVKRWHRVQF